MIWKKDNPGSPCCSCCPCYPLTANGQPVSGATVLTEQSGGPEYNSGCKKLGSAGANFKSGQGYLEGNDSCFSPRSNPDGWAMSFWVKPNSNIGVITCSTSVPSWEPGLITKGYWTHDAVSSACASPTQGSATTHGEWFIVLTRGTTGNPVEMVVYAVTANAIHPSVNWSFMAAGGIILDTRTSTFGVHRSEWNFVYWYTRAGHSWLHIRGETESSWNQYYQNINTQGGFKNEDVPLRVGTMIEGSNEYRIGTNGGDYCVDNLTFDNNPTTFGSTSLPITSPPTIPTEATALYNSGSGKACPSIGR